MKRILRVMLGLSLLLAACNDGEEIIVVKPGVRLSPPVPIVFTSDGGNKVIAVITNQEEWTVESDQSWCKATAQGGGKFLISVEKTEARADLPKATVTVTAGTGKNQVTAQITVDQTAVPPVDLSEKELSNCYIVPTKGVYKFYAGCQGKSDTPTVTDFKGCMANWAWMTSEGLIGVNEKVSDDGYITFWTPEDKYIQGNAVIALTKNGITLWTWHIWVTDCVKVLDGNPFMNVNIGATSDEPGTVESLGLYYQWGRKDPMIGAAGIGDYNITSFNEQTAFSAGKNNGTSYTAFSVVNPDVAGPWNVDGSNTKFTQEQLAALPTTYVGQWGSSPTYDVMVWPKATDPCPPGWHVPIYTEMANYLGSPKIDYSTYWGMIQGGNNYWPASGYRHTYIPYSSNGRLFGVGIGAMYWSASQRKDKGFAAGILFSASETQVNDFMITYGLSTRCIQDGVY